MNALTSPAMIRPRVDRPPDAGVRPWFRADWVNVLMIHFAVEEEHLRRAVPFELDCWNGRAWVSLVLFTMRGLRPAGGGRLAAWLFRPFGEQRFLNVRTYVRRRDEAGIYFLAEWMSDWLSVRLGPAVYGLPYRWGTHDYPPSGGPGRRHWRVTDAGGAGAFACTVADSEPLAVDAECVAGSRDEFLMERYTAFTLHRERRRLFRIVHESWRQRQVEAEIQDDALLRRAFPWWSGTRLAGANYSTGVCGVSMGRPIAIRDDR